MSNTATYSPDDNKLRLYVGRVPRDEYEALRKEGWTSTPKQDCDFVATWTPTREDTALSYLDEGDDIEVEEYGPEERAADRAERFEGYREKRIDEATGHADRFESGPSVFGHQNAARAQRQANRHDRVRGRALSQWSKAEYWQRRISGVIGHALYKSSAAVRRSRILRLEAEERKQVKILDEAAKRYAAWQKVLTLDGVDDVGRFVAEDGCYPKYVSGAAGRLAYTLANVSCYGEYVHPRRPESIPASLYRLLTDPTDPITPREAATLWLADASDPADTESWSNRWRNHFANRLAFERSLLAAEGGTVAEAEMEPSGWIFTGNRTGSVFTDVASGWKQIYSVHRSPVTKRVTSVKVKGTTTSETRECLVTVNVERLGEDCYRAPTDEDREAFKAIKSATKAMPVPTINPTDEDAKRLQAAWNEKAASVALKHGRQSKAAEVEESTQQRFSGWLKHEYVEIRTVRAGDVTFKIRVKRAGYGDYYRADAVVVLTDKPRKEIPAAYWSIVEAAQQLETVEA